MLNDELAAFASETGYTAIEWMAMWRAGSIDETTPGAQELHARAEDLEQRWLASQGG